LGHFRKQKYRDGDEEDRASKRESLTSPPTLGERCQRVVARRFVPIRWRQVALELAVTNSPKPWLGSRGHLHFHYTPNDDVIGEHVVVVLVVPDGGTLED
jgi:hypothetical protein